MRCLASLPACVLLMAALVLLQGCSAWRISSLADQLQKNGPETTLQALEAIEPADRDRAQYLLNRGSLKFMTGDFNGSISDLEQAKQIMRSLRAVSLTETSAAATINETLRTYAGTPSERVLNHVLLGLNYLAINDLSGARVEMLQANVLMQELAEDDSLSGQLASARFLAGLVYELGGEWDDAMISYRRAAGIMKARGLQIPEALATSLLNTSFRQGFREEYLGYVAEFGRKAETRPAGDGEIIVFYGEGVVSKLRQRKIPLYIGELQQVISLAMPYYPPTSSHLGRLILHVNGKHVATDLAEDVNTLVRDDLEARMPAILAATTARTVAKYFVVKEAGKRDELIGIIANIATLFTEVADTRSWNMLPSNLQVARLTVPGGSVPGITGLPAEAYTGQLEPAARGATVVVIASSLSKKVQSYQRYY